MDFRTWKKTASKKDTSYVATWREDQGLDRLSDAENEERFDAYLWLVGELDKIALRNMQYDELGMVSLSGQLSFTADRHGESVDFDDLSLDCDDEVDVDELSDENVAF